MEKDKRSNLEHHATLGHGCSLTPSTDHNMN